MKAIKNKNVLLGITGGIAAYKAAEIVRLLQKNDCAVTVVMTENAKRFITPLTFETLTGNPVYSGLFDNNIPGAMEHIELGKKADLFIIAPATANIISKAANGIADDLLSCLLLTFNKQVIIAPAMNVYMWLNAVVQENILRLKGRGVRIIDPEKGELACGDEGLGRLADIDVIIGEALYGLRSSESLKNKKVLITAGPTREHIDPVRFISNPSSGKMGFALALEAVKRGSDVALISGPTNLIPTPEINFIPVITAKEMKNNVLKYYNESDIVIMSAAVGDYEPVKYSKQKIKKEGGSLILELKKTVDILSELGRQKGSKVLVGFAAETENISENALKKLKEKNLDIIVANKIGIAESGFESDNNKAIVISSGGNKEELPLMSKTNLATHILDIIVSCLEKSYSAKKTIPLKRNVS